MPKSKVVTARIPEEIKLKIQSLNINVTEVIRKSLIKAVKKAERKMQQDIIDFDVPVFTEELHKLTPKERYEAYKNGKLSPESIAAMDAYREAKLNLWEQQNTR